MEFLWSIVDRITYSPYLNLVVGLLLVVAAIFELSETLVEELLGVDVRVAHALLLVGLVTLIRALEEIFQGLEHVRRIRARSQRNSSQSDDRA